MRNLGLQLQINMHMSHGSNAVDIELDHLVPTEVYYTYCQCSHLSTTILASIYPPDYDISQDGLASSSLCRQSGRCDSPAASPSLPLPRQAHVQHCTIDNQVC